MKKGGRRKREKSRGKVITVAIILNYPCISLHHQHLAVGQISITARFCTPEEGIYVLVLPSRYARGI